MIQHLTGNTILLPNFSAGTHILLSQMKILGIFRKFSNGIADELLRNVDPEYLKEIGPGYRESVKEYLKRYGNKK